tara:strand:+ start:356695 stop:356901 length:207 start_codon:yes stop_codon:yes gene_type:complete
MYTNSHEVTLKKLNENREFLLKRIDEIEGHIGRLEESNQTVAPITQSILELNKDMVQVVDQELSRIDS